jgi:OOP family OmpA-OmpF porin
MKTSPRHLVASGAMALAIAVGFAPAANAVSSVVDVPPPMVSDYWVSVALQPGGVLVFDGFAPDSATRATFGERSGADVNWLKLGSGAPTAYAEAVTFGLNAMEHLSEGRFALRGSVLSFSGVAASQADFIALRQSLAADLPSGLILAKAEISAPPVEDFAFDARLQSNGNTILSGYAPDPELEQRLLALAGSRSSSTLRFGSGAPTNFESMLSTGMPLLQLMSEGELRLENGKWLLSGTPKSAADAASIEAAFSSNHLAESGWSLAMGAPAAAMPAEATEPYQWLAAKSEAGSVEMSGMLPTDALQRVLAMRMGSDVSDRTEVATSAPENFINMSLAAADALDQLESGKVGFDGSKWFVEGLGKAASSADRVSEYLATSGVDWSININDPIEPVVVAQAEVPATGPSQPAATTPAEQPVATTAEQPAATAPAATSTQSEIARCQSALGEVSAQNAILFRSGAAILADSAMPILTSVAAILGSCPDVAIDVAGHTDSDGEASANLALSVARAEAVINALINLGVAPERLYALGFGESQPIAANTSAAGKAQNRRIVISVHP